MAKISLRNYDRLIENLIENAQHDEAIAHCRHILQTFPKYIEAYRLLGKAYLEAKRYTEAVDIFQRVLTSVPDDFVSHVGLSIIADDQGILDDAIWHMERAFEVQPSNAAIQGELQRLFGRRDGVEPPKIRLTRGALAHMYIQGELYSQAISEIRAVLANDPQRVDMQVLLAKAYYYVGQKAEATDSCSQLLKQYPYCLDANRILVEILAGTPHAESAQAYRQRVIELEPYSAFAQDSLFHSDQIADTEVSLERLEYAPQAAAPAANWGGSLGLSPGSDSAAASPSTSKPDWLKAPAVPASAQEPGPSPAEASQEPIPDFLRQAGWGESSGVFQESESVPADQAQAEPALQADLPDWVRAMAPADQETPMGGANEPVPPALEVPDWLQNLDRSQSAGVSPSAGAPQTAPSSEENPDWLQKLDSNRGASPPPQPRPAVPLRKGALETQTPPPGVAALPAGNQAAPAGPEPVRAAGPDPLGGLGKSTQEQDDALAWLETLAAKHGAKAEELVTDPNTRTEVAPDWVDKAKTISGPGEAAPHQPVEAGPASTDDQTGIWLRHLEESEAETFIAKKEEAEPAAASEPSDWLSGLSEEGTFSQISNEPLESSGEPPILSAQDTPDWLREEPVQPAQPSSGEVPDWLRGIEEPLPPVEQPGASQSVSAGQGVDLPSWLASLDHEEAQAASASPAAPGEELPPWLAGGNEPEPRAAAPTQPEEWHPVNAGGPPAEPVRSVKQPLPAEGAPPAKAQTRELSFKIEEPQPVKQAAPRSPKALKVPGKPEIEMSLANAQTEMGRGNIGAAIDLYAKLIRKGKSLEEIIRDLREALYRYPVEVPLWQVLGDAYMRSNRLQDALDAYTKAEELLR
ncbi:MAG TPA: tetratricopeptide repeat protein [Anaerolineales bacterium]|nr:tetratricopeptide repeat protein [Anaerolineales bacterium]